MTENGRLMHLVILGSTGKIGSRIVDHALDDGHDLTLIVRDAAKLPAIAREHARLVIAAPGDIAKLREAVVGSEAVISALGPRANAASEGQALRRAMQSTLAAMAAAGVRRIINLSGAGVTAPGDSKPLLDRVASRIVRLAARHILAAKQAEFELLAASDAEWVAVRPPLVTDGPRTGRYCVGLDVLYPGARISRADIADFMVAQAVEPTFARRAPFIVNMRHRPFVEHVSR